MQYESATFARAALIFLAAFLPTYFILPHFIRKMREAGFLGIDLNKVRRKLSIKEKKDFKNTRSAGKGLPVVPRNGGIAIVFGLTLATLIAIALIPFQNISLVLAATLTAVLVGLIGVIEDFVPLSQLYRTLLPAFAALPLMAVNAGTTSMTLPFIGAINFGILYPLLLIPIGVMACSNLFNLLAGFNGLEAGNAAIVSAGLLAASVLLNEHEAAVLSLALFAATLAFLKYNWFPAKIFPGNSATYLFGGVVAAIVIIGNMERVGAIMLLPQIVEFFLKAKSRFQAEVFGSPDAKGIMQYNGPTHSLTHLLMKRYRLTEPQLVLALYALQIAFVILALASLNL